jgi:hypothetical protein
MFDIMKKVITFAHLLLLITALNSVSAQRLSRDYNVSLLTNQVGYLPASTKTCLLQVNQKTNFEVVEITSGRVAYGDTLIPQQADFGMYAVGDLRSQKMFTSSR